MSPNASETKTIPQPELTSELDSRTFEQWFDEREVLSSREGEIGIVDVIPEGYKPGDVPIILAGGWTEGPEAQKDTMRVLFEEGRRVIAVQHPSHGNTVEPVEGYVEAELLKAANYEDVAAHKGLEKVDVVGHSQGGIDAIVWATLSDRVRNVLLVNSAGLIGKDSLVALGARFTPKIIRSAASSFYNKAAGRQLFYGSKSLAGHPAKLKRAFEEIVAISKSNLSGAIDNLRSKGHKVGVLQSRSDTVFPDKRIAQNVTDESGGLKVDAWASNVKRRAGHDEMIIHPERGAVAINQMLRSMEAEPAEPGPVEDPTGKMKGFFKAIQKKRQEATLSQRGMAWAQSRWQTSKAREMFFTGENAKRNQYIASAAGIAAMALAARKGLDLMFDSGAEAVGGLDLPTGGEATSSPEPILSEVPAPSEPATPAPTESVAPEPAMPTESQSPVETSELPSNDPRGDISAEYDLPSGYLQEFAEGYEVTAQPGSQTDSVWRAAEHALTDYLGQQPNVEQIDALKDILGEHLLDVGDKVQITTEQIEQAIKAAKL